MKAEEGVKIYIAIFKEVYLTGSQNSKHSKSVLKNLHPNIQGTIIWHNIETLMT